MLLATAVSMFLVILAQSAATSRAYAVRYNQRFQENTDLVGLGLANITAGLSGTFPVNGSPTKTEMVDEAKSHTQVAQLTTAVVIGIVLLFLTKPLQFMPNAVLAAVVFLIGVKLSPSGDRRIYDLRRTSSGRAGDDGRRHHGRGRQGIILPSSVVILTSGVTSSPMTRSSPGTRGRFGWPAPRGRGHRAGPGHVPVRVGSSTQRGPPLRGGHGAGERHDPPRGLSSAPSDRRHRLHRRPDHPRARRPAAAAGMSSPSPRPATTSGASSTASGSPTRSEHATRQLHEAAPLPRRPSRLEACQVAR